MRSFGKALTAALVCAALFGCGSLGSAGWSGRVTVEGHPGSLGAGDALGNAMYDAHQRAASRDEGVELLFGEGVTATDLRDDAEVFATAEE